MSLAFAATPAMRAEGSDAFSSTPMTASTSCDPHIECKRREWRRNQALFASEPEDAWRKRKGAKLDDSIEFALADYNPRVLIGMSICVCLGYGMFGVARLR